MIVIMIDIIICNMCINHSHNSTGYYEYEAFLEVILQ